MPTLFEEIYVLIGEGVRHADRALFFGPPLDSDVFVEYPPSARFPEVLADLRFFKSRSDARRNGWDRDIPDGYSDYVIGKFKRRIIVLKILVDTPDEPEC